MKLSDRIEGAGEPRRVQLSRKKGWRMPENTVKVTRPGPWGNPFVVSEKIAPGKGAGGFYTAVPTALDAVECFRTMLLYPGEYADALNKAIPELRGKNLACWCKLDQPCHADVLLELANTP
jgi:hypothetical protein